MKIFALGDIHGVTKYLEAAAELIRQADLVAILGDVSGNGTSESAEEVLNLIEGYNRNILAVHGNWDRKEVLDLFEERGYSIHSSGRIIQGIGFFGVGGSNVTPMNTVTEYIEEEILDYLRIGYNKIQGLKKIVLISHAPPKNSVDRTFLGLKAGSTSIREFVEENPIDLCLCGHIHEAAGIQIIGNCTVLNPGPFKKGRYAVIDIDEGIIVNPGKIKLKRFHFFNFNKRK
jgi:Icc-related predicted phosphoesterase